MRFSQHSEHDTLVSEQRKIHRSLISSFEAKIKKSFEDMQQKLKEGVLPESVGRQQFEAEVQQAQAVRWRQFYRRALWHEMSNTLVKQT